MAQINYNPGVSENLANTTVRRGSGPNNDTRFGRVFCDDLIVSGHDLNFIIDTVIDGRAGAPDGIATLDAQGHVPAIQLPPYVDDILEFANLAALPNPGSVGIIYVTVDTSKAYRWSGSTYTEISAGPANTDALAEGSTNLYFTGPRVESEIAAYVKTCTIWHPNGTTTTIQASVNTDVARAAALLAARTAATSGDEIRVAPGRYEFQALPINLSKNGVNWYFPPGSTTAYTGPDSVNMRGYFDDSSAGANGPVIFCVSGNGKFTLTPQPGGDQGPRGIVNITNVGSNVSIVCESIEMLQSNNGYIAAVFQNAGTLGIRARKISSSGVYGGVWWVDGDCHIDVPQITAEGLAVYSHQTSATTPTGYLWINTHLISVDPVSLSVFADGVNAESRVWIKANELVGGVSVSNGKVYISAQKLSGEDPIGQNGGVLWADIQKVSSSKSGWINTTGGTGYYRISHFEDMGITDDNDNWLGGGIYASGGTITLFDGVVDPIALNGLVLDAILAAGGTINLFNVAVSSPSSARDLVRTSGSLKVNLGTTYDKTKTSGTITKLLDTDFVPEGGTNLYFTPGRASAAAPVQSVAGRTGNVTLAVADVANAVSTARTISTTAPLTGGGNLGANLTFSITAATTGADGSMSAADKLKLNGIATGATANQTDAYLLARANHTGTQLLATISDAGTAASKNTGTSSGQVPILDAGGKLASAVIPSVALQDYLGTVASQAAMLALTGEQGDYAFRSDTAGGTTMWILNTSDPTQLANWKQVSAPGNVFTVNSQTGTVVLTTTEISEGTNQYFTPGRVLSALPNTTRGDTLYQSATGLDRRAIGSVGKYYRSDGTDPQWATLAAGDIVGTIAVGVGGTGVATFGGTNTLLYTTSADTLSNIATANSAVLITSGSGVPSWSTTLPAVSGVNLTNLNMGSAASGTLAVGRGGTGVTTFGGTNRILYTSATDTLTALTAVNSAVLGSSGAGAPTWFTTLPAVNGSNLTNLTAANITGNFTQKINSTATATSNSTLQLGSLEFQPFTLNNSWFGENVYYNGGFQRRAGGACGLFYFQGEEGQFRFDTASGGPAANVQLKINASGSVAMGGTISSSTGVYTGAGLLVTGTDATLQAGNLVFSLATKRIKYKSGTGQPAGNATLVAGTVTVTNSTVTANTVITPSRKTAGGVVGNLTYTVSAGASFTINSDNALDTSVVSYSMAEVV